MFGFVDSLLVHLKETILHIESMEHDLRLCFISQLHCFDLVLLLMNDRIYWTFRLLTLTAIALYKLQPFQILPELILHLLVLLLWTALELFFLSV